MKNVWHVAGDGQTELWEVNCGLKPTDSAVPLPAGEGSGRLTSRPQIGVAGAPPGCHPQAPHLNQ